MEKLRRNNRHLKEELLVDETIFAQANGFLGTRGSFIEGYGTDFEYNQTYINAFYDSYDYYYEENLSGFPQEGQKIVNLLDGTKIEFEINGNLLNLSNCVVVDLKREYNIEKGLTKRVVHYKTLDEFEFILTETKIVSMEYRELIAVKVILESLNYSGLVKVKSYLQKSRKKLFDDGDPRINTSSNDNLIISNINPDQQTITCKTSRSNLSVSTAIIHNEEFNVVKEAEKLVGTKDYSISSKSTIEIVKYIIYTSNLYHADYLNDQTKLIKELSYLTFDQLIISQTNYFKEFWDKNYIKINAGGNIELLLNYNIYQLNCSGGESEYHNIAAKGLSGEGYEGHYFWDTEIYMLPYFILTNPKKARNLLMYRYNTIAEAKVEAENLGYNKGIKFPWRTINGEETSPYYPAGSAQFHINSDIAYAVIKYFEVTSDIDFMIDYGFEMLILTARFLVESVNKNEKYYHLNGVTGPDEYTTVVDDNYYTNQLLIYHFKYTCKFYKENFTRLANVINKLQISASEIDKMKDIAKHIYLPFDKELNIYAQDSTFLKKERLDLSTIPSDKFPLLIHYHPLFLYKHQVLKQADTMLAMMLLDYDDLMILEDSFNYYEPITTHDSSLSKCIYSILAFKLKKYNLACNYFKSILETDYLDAHKNTKHGLHIANLGGSYLAFIYGVVGLRIKDGYLKLNPVVTSEIYSYEVSLRYNNETITIKVDDNLTITSPGNVSLEVYGEKMELNGIYQMALKK